MNALWHRFLKLTYRREPLSSFLITMGAVDAIIGGLNNRPPLLLFGMGAAGVALVLRWWLLSQRKPLEQFNQSAVHYLPGRSSRPQLPMLSVSRKEPPTL